MQVPLLDLKQQYATIKDDVMAVTAEVYESQHFILGPQVEKLEKEIADYTAATHAVGVSSGTDALVLSLMTAGIGPGDRVLTTPYTFFATAGSIARIGATPVFVDIAPATYNIDCQALARALDAMPDEQLKQCRAVIPVHLYGQSADMDGICEQAKKHNMLIIEDAAQAIGSEYNGKRVGAIGDFGCFSFFPSKNLGAFGDGGIVTTNSPDLYERMRVLRVHGGKPKYYHAAIGGNFRLDALQAAIVSVKLKHLDSWTAQRQENAARYRELFAQAGLDDGRITLPAEAQSRHIYNQFVISVSKNRDGLLAFLREKGVGAEIYYPVPLHLQRCFAYLGYETGDFPVSEYAAGHTLALPIYPELTAEQQQYVVDTMAAFWQ